eukprot:3877279-Alexandrium_andersonii.AAC.1
MRVGNGDTMTSNMSPPPPTTLARHGFLMHGDKGTMVAKTHTLAAAAAAAAVQKRAITRQTAPPITE